MEDSRQVSVDEAIEMLGERWGSVYTVYVPEYDSESHIVRNHTDEGLGMNGQERKEVRGESLVEALENALKQSISED